MFFRITSLSVVLSCAVLAAGCGDSTDSSSTTDTVTEPGVTLPSDVGESAPETLAEVKPQDLSDTLTGIDVVVVARSVTEIERVDSPHEDAELVSWQFNVDEQLYEAPTAAELAIARAVDLESYPIDGEVSAYEAVPNAGVSLFGDLANMDGSVVAALSFQPFPLVAGSPWRVGLIASTRGDDRLEFLGPLAEQHRQQFDATVAAFAEAQSIETQNEVAFLLRWITERREVTEPRGAGFGDGFGDIESALQPSLDEPSEEELLQAEWDSTRPDWRYLSPNYAPESELATARLVSLQIVSATEVQRRGAASSDFLVAVTADGYASLHAFSLDIGSHGQPIYVPDDHEIRVGLFRHGPSGQTPVYTLGTVPDEIVSADSWQITIDAEAISQLASADAELEPGLIEFASP